MKISDTCKIIDSGYCNKDEWALTKAEQEAKYNGAKCVLVKSDTKGLRMWVTTMEVK